MLADNAWSVLTQVYRCADNRWLQLLGLDAERFVPPLLRALGLTPANLASLDNVGTIALFDSIFASQPAAHWEGRLKAEGVWHQRVPQLDEVLVDPQAQDAFVHVPWATFPMVASPLRLSCSDQHGPAGPPPKAGEHTAAVLRDAGVSEADVAQIVHDIRRARAKL